MFKIGDIVRINPNPGSNNTTYFLTKDAAGYFWPEYMLVPNKLKTLLKYKNLLKEN